MWIAGNTSDAFSPAVLSPTGRARLFFVQISAGGRSPGGQTAFGGLGGLRPPVPAAPERPPGALSLLLPGICPHLKNKCLPAKNIFFPFAALCAKILLSLSGRGPSRRNFR